MTLPAPGNPISIQEVNVEIGQTPTFTEDLSFLNGLLLAPDPSPNMGAFFSKAYFQANNQGNCNNGNCTNNCNCGNIQCTNCFISGTTNCLNCQPQAYLQTNCNCACTYNCETSATATYNCNCACNCSKIICTKLYQIGMMPYNIFAADQQYGEWLKKNDRAVYRGYIKWARNVTAWIDGGGPDFMIWVKDKELRSQKQKEAATKWAYKIATPWSKHMAYLMGAVQADNDMGRIIMKIGRPICKIVYLLPKKRVVPDFVATWTMWALFFFSYYTASAVVAVNKFSIEGVKRWMNT
jgi:hypothetical protein